MGITVIMALIDYVPVVLFFIASVILMKDMYAGMTKGQYALLSAGTVMVLLGGLFKCTWKLLYGLGICDFKALDQAFFPLQGFGFVMMFIALLMSGDKVYSLVAAAPVAVYDSNLIFIIMQVIGLGGIQLWLAAKARKYNKPAAVVMFIIAFVFMLGMGYLGSKFDDSSAMHWTAQLTNTISQLSLLTGVVILHNTGMGKE